MIFIPGFIIAILSFPGVIVHEAAHQLMCRLTGTPVLNVCYFQIATPSGFVIHESPSSPSKGVLISVAPFLLNTVLGFLIGLPAGLAVAAKVDVKGITALLGWLGVSVAMHAFPSTGDAACVLKSLSEPAAPIGLRIVGYPIVGLIYAGSLLSMAWLDAIYGGLVCFMLPKMILSTFA